MCDLLGGDGGRECRRRRRSGGRGGRRVDLIVAGIGRQCVEAIILACETPLNILRYIDQLARALGQVKFTYSAQGQETA